MQRNLEQGEHCIWHQILHANKLLHATPSPTKLSSLTSAYSSRNNFFHIFESHHLYIACFSEPVLHELNVYLALIILRLLTSELY